MYIYKFINEHGELIYVGITKCKNRRINQHIKADLRKIKEARYIYYSYDFDEYYIKRLEKYMIYKYKPKYNKIGGKNAVIAREIEDKEWILFGGADSEWSE